MSNINDYLQRTSKFKANQRNFSIEHGDVETYKSIKKCKSTQKSDLSFQKDEEFIVAVSTTSKNWWMFINAKGETGKIPSNYMTMKFPSKDA